MNLDLVAAATEQARAVATLHELNAQYIRLLPEDYTGYTPYML